MACTVWTAYRVSLLLIGLCFAGFTVHAATVGEGPRRPVASLNDQHRQLCPLISNCTRWCSDCSLRLASNLQDSFEETCPNWSSEFPTAYKNLVRCTEGHMYEACFCAIYDSKCRKCEHSTPNRLACFSQDNDGNIVFTPLYSDSDIISSYLEDVCPRCSCSTDKPTTPEAPTTQRKMKTRFFVEPVPPRPNENAMTTAAGDAAGPDKVVIIAAAVGGGALLILIIVTCVCIWRRCVIKQPKNREEEYVYIEEMQTMRSQASMMNSTNLTSNDGIHPPCGHRQFNNEVYNLNGVTNRPTSPDIPPELPGNHPPPLAPYQELNRGSRVRRDIGNTGMGSGPCPHCRQMANDRSATAPLLDRPRGAEELTIGVEGSKNPYMALLKNNTCPTPAQEPICSCHARPLSECSSVTGSVLSDQHDSSSQAASTLNSVGHESNPRPTSGSEIQESPYYFKMEGLVEEDISSPKSPEYFKLEDAQTLPLDSVIAPMLNSNPDPNANDLHLKSISDDSNVGPPDILRKEQLPNSEEGSEKANDNSKQTPNITSGTEGTQSESTPKGKNSTDSLPKGDYTHAITA